MWKLTVFSQGELPLDFGTWLNIQVRARLVGKVWERSEALAGFGINQGDADLVRLREASEIG